MTSKTNQTATNFWDQLFGKQKDIWGMAPSDSALFANDYFQKNKISKILIPGIGYGRNAAAFAPNKFNITGIEISPTAITQARENGFNCPIYTGSVLDMPFNDERYEGIFCYALLHLFNRNERKAFLQKCFDQLLPGGQMIFSIVSTKADLYGTGRLLSKDRYHQTNGLDVFFYSMESAQREFKNFWIIDCREIDEPIKFITNLKPLKCILVICKKE